MKNLKDKIISIFQGGYTRGQLNIMILQLRSLLRQFNFTEKLEEDTNKTRKFQVRSAKQSYRISSIGTRSVEATCSKHVPSAIINHKPHPL